MNVSYIGDMPIKRIAIRAVDALGLPRYWVLQTMFEARMLVVRLRACLPTHKSRIRGIERQPKVLLHFGSGSIRREGWTNIDGIFGPDIDVQLDLRRALPFSSNVADYCYSEHFLEHLTPEEGIRHLKEVRRILKPSGVYRIAVPAGILFVEKYLANDDAFFKLAFPWAERPMEAVYCALNWGGQHRNIFDYRELEYLSRKAGFTECRTSDANQSSVECLRIDRSEPQRIAETIYVEMVSPEKESHDDLG